MDRWATWEGALHKLGLPIITASFVIKVLQHTEFYSKLVKKILGLKESGWMIEGLKALSEAREARNAGTLRWGGISPLS